ncbi:hypothetical protein [Paraflavitalea pollutisoli]|uniref:hypothetical protein n=1 Tax=Paraflavitalea pollutisoli TaxID=3034143 RepID=UPI0023ECEE67|nr:hypothetical protein [Paraflavitalea sp. H1-2-19X]
MLIIAILTHLLILAFFGYAASQPGGSGLGLAFAVIWLPAVFIATAVASIVLAIVRRRELFRKGMTQWTILTLLFCTPLPLLAVAIQFKPTTWSPSSAYHPRNGKIYKVGSWNYSSSKQPRYLVQYFIADSLDYATQGEAAFKKDSTWTYFTKHGDTLKVEKYQSGQLLYSKQYVKD